MTCMKLAAGAAGAVLLSAVSVLAQAAGTVEFDRAMESEILGWDLDYSIYYPPGFDENERKYPVIYLMQGGGSQTHNDWFLRGRAATIFDELISSGNMPPFIAVAPNARRTPEPEFNTYYMNDTDGGVRWEDMFVEEFVPHVEATYPVLASEDFRAIAGISMGGYAALAYSLKYPDMFVAAAALSPAIRTDEQIVNLDQPGYDRRYGKAWGMGLEADARLTDEYYSYSVFEMLENASDEVIGGTEFFVDTGADDIFFDGSVLLHSMLRSEGETERTLSSNHRFMIREGGHTWDYWRSGLPEAIRFIGDVIED
ncbi:alpha/beta hydrolase [Roseitranquillus sediminis]|uniref:alpha/beta hydrolase n=1 Tax=Roseitranquillus sediminis TaxID=2809051 RepID=UPI001D0C5052|nr:alpha/beta hydrolase-fold protein [Roseitranquillus sediminis]MBM9594207.1 hypothetical protein [Roseitranquillus sediminis]